MLEYNEWRIPACSQDCFFADECGNISMMAGSIANPDSIIDDTAVVSVLQYGAIIPPLSPWKGVQRLRPGYCYQGTRKVGPIYQSCAKEISPDDTEKQADAIEATLDNVLKKTLRGEREPVLLFSGGVDSGLLASRLATLGYRDSLLVNYSFGDSDPESKLAEAMAEALGLKYVRVSSNRQHVSCLSQPGRIYPQPFGDQSTGPTFDLACAVSELLAGQRRTILDGTGADGAFGMTRTLDYWRGLIRAPEALRRMLAAVYGRTLWHCNGRLSRRACLYRRSIDRPLLAAVIARNALHGVLYDASQCEYVDNLLVKWISDIGSPSLSKQIVAADLALTCANIFAQKGKPIFESAGHKVICPFLDEETVAVALDSCLQWKMDESKAPLKRALSRYVPREMVYRPKSLFTDPEGHVFYEPAFIAYLRCTIESTGPIAHLLEPKPIAKACDLLIRGKPLPQQTKTLLWTVVFTDRWYRTVFDERISPFWSKLKKCVQYLN